MKMKMLQKQYKMNCDKNARRAHIGQIDVWDQGIPRSRRN
jgi:hypothetical protein